MKDFLFQYWKRLSRRERFFCATAASVMLLYAVYALALENPVRDAVNKSARLERLNAEYQGLLSGHRRLDGLAGGLASLTRELEMKREEERLLSEVVQSARPVEALLRELRQAAGELPVHLVDMDIQAGMVSKSVEFTANPSPAGVAQRKPPWPPKASQPEKVNYAVSRIVLTYRSTYRGAVNYFLKVMDLPYGISVKTIEMERSNGAANAIGGPQKHGGGGFAEGELPLNTKLGIEIFYR